MSEAAEKPNPADFSKDEKPGEYELRFSVRGEIRMTINAESEAAARAQAEAMLEDETFGTELDTADDVSVDSVRKSRAMYRVTRGGQKMQSSHLEAGDLPREPDERGF